MRSTFACRCLGIVVLFSATFLVARADNPVFSGPQPGEKLAPFKVTVALGENAGKVVDPVAAADGKPTLLVFVHKLTRPGMALTRGLTAYAKSQSAHGVVSGIVWLDDDQAKAEAYLNRVSGSLQFVVPVGVSVDGGEGPGAYGLNRNVELTVLIANNNQVTANFALVQPSVSEAPLIAAQLAKLIDQLPPTSEEIQELAYPGGAMTRQARMRRGVGQPPPDSGTPQQRTELRRMMESVVSKNLTPVELRSGVQAINEWAVGNEDRQAALGRMSDAILKRGLGSELVQPVLKKWRQQYPPDADKPDADASDEASNESAGESSEQ